MPISVIISYCSKERCFLQPMLEQCSKFSNDIVVTFGTHLYDGTVEDISQIQEMARTFPNVQFVEYVVGNKNYNGMGVQHRKQAYWHNMARWTGIQHLRVHDWVLLLDCDEILEGDIFKMWFDKMERTSALHKTHSYKIANYWYFKDPTNRAKTLEDSVLLIHSKHLSKYNIFGDLERDYTIQQSETHLVRQVRGTKGEVMAHHFSWVRTRDGLSHKIKHWGHANDFRDPDKIINEIYKDDNVNDVIHGYQYDKVSNLFNINMV